MKLLTIAVCFAVLSGCGAAPTKHDFDNTRVVAASYDKVWDGVIAFFASRNIPVKTIAKDSGVIFAETTSMDAVNQGFADCGKASVGDAITGERASFNVYVKRSGDNKQVISVTSSFSQSFNNKMAGMLAATRNCTSTGTFEKLVLNGIQVD